FDISSRTQVHQFTEVIQEKIGVVDMICNVAGISIWGTLEFLTLEDWEKLNAVNVMGPVYLLSQLVPPMIARGRGGHVVNVSSAAGLLGLPWHAAYSAAMSGLRGISEVLRFELACHGIAVSLVCPGAVHTGLVDTIQIRGLDSET